MNNTEEEYIHSKVNKIIENLRGMTIYLTMFYMVLALVFSFIVLLLCQIHLDLTYSILVSVLLQGSLLVGYLIDLIPLLKAIQMAKSLKEKILNN